MGAQRAKEESGTVINYLLRTGGGHALSWVVYYSCIVIGVPLSECWCALASRNLSTTVPGCQPDSIITCNNVHVYHIH